MFKAADKKEFVTMREMINPILKPYVTAYTVEDYENMNAICYLSGDKQTGYAITGENDLISVFSLNNNGISAVKSAIKNGAKTLDCIGEYLAGFYNKFGFKEINRMEWNDQYAPENWNYEKFGKPDVIFMQLDIP